VLDQRRTTVFASQKPSIFAGQGPDVSLLTALHEQGVILVIMSASRVGNELGAPYSLLCHLGNFVSSEIDISPLLRQMIERSRRIYEDDVMK
jgi:hypothetical protein